MSRPLTPELIEAITAALVAADRGWLDLKAHLNASSNPTMLAPAQDKSDVPSDWVKAAAEAILQSNTRLTSNAQTFVAQTFARASQYDTVKFSPKQWEWFNKIMLSAGVEAVELTSGGNNG